MKAKLISILLFVCLHSAANAQESRDTLNYKVRFNYAMSLFEQDSLVAACENFYKVVYMLEEDDSVKSKKSKKKFVDICNAHLMLGHIYSHYDLIHIALSHYTAALGYAKAMDDSHALSIVYKFMGIAHHAYNTDSALYYYQKCLDAHPNHLNKIDLDKAKAEILFYNKNERDSALNLLRSNLGIIEHEHVRQAYYTLLGEMMCDCKQYDSAIYYLSKSVDSELYFLQLNSANNLSRAYDSLGDYEKKSYYDNIVARLGMERIDSNLNTDRVRAMNDIFNEHKQAELIKKQNEEILSMKEKLDKEQTNVNMNAFLGSEICKKILNNESVSMVQEDYDLLLQSANLNLGGFADEMLKEYPKLKKRICVTFACC